MIEHVKPRLEELMNFPFPDEPSALPGEGPFVSNTDWPQEGLLSAMGYHVGLNDPGQSHRRAILRRVFEGPLVNVVDHEYMTEWGGDRTTTRLYKLSWSIGTASDLVFVHDEHSFPAARPESKGRLRSMGAV